MPRAAQWTRLLECLVSWCDRQWLAWKENKAKKEGEARCQ